jgi:hypothetical protein
MTRGLLGLAALAILAGCGAKLGESTVSDRSSRVLMRDIFERRFGGDVAAQELARHRKLPDQAWSAPRLVADGKAALTPEGRLAPYALLHVELTRYPKISCAGVGPGSKPVPREPESGPPMEAAEIAALGAPEPAQEIWMLGSANEVAAPWGFGPEWLGNYLRQAGVGRAVHFPATQDCAAMTESMPERLPRHVFIGRDEIAISARTPFTARVLEACPAEVAIREHVIRSRHVPFNRLGFGPAIGFTDERTLATARVVGRCARGEARFELGPFASGGAAEHGDPSATLTVKTP